MMLANLYRHCAMMQERPRYWPDDFAPRVEGLDHRLVRDVLFPDPVTPEDGSRLGLFWWALRARVGGCAAQDGQEQLRKHLNDLIAALGEAEQLTWTRLHAAADAACLFAPILPFVDGIKNVLDLVGAMKDAPSVESILTRATRTRKGLIDQALGAAAGRELAMGTRQAAVETAKNNARELALVAGLVPFAIVVDEAEMLDEITIAMLKVVLRHSAARGLIVLTINTDTPMGKGAGTRSQTLTRWLDEEERADRLIKMTLDPMTLAELTEVAVQYLDLQESYQAETSALATVITASQGYPGRLVRFLDVPSIRTAVTGRGDLPAELESLTDHDQERQLFQVLPQKARQALGAASLPGAVVPARWLTSPPPGTSDGAPSLAQSEVEAALSTGWVELDSAGMLRFISETAYRIISQAMPAELTRDRQRQVLTGIAAWVDAAHNDHSWSDLVPSVCESLLTALTTDNAQHHGFESKSAWQAELMRIRRVTGRTAMEEAGLAQLEERLRTGTPSTQLVVATAEALLDAGHNQRALDVLQAELDRLSAKHGTGAAATMPALANLAAAWAEMARRRHGYPEARALFDHAIGLHRELLQGRLNHLPKTNIRIPNSRLTLSRLLADAYRFAEAVDEGGTCVQEMKTNSNYGPDHPKTLTARSDLASWAGKAGDAKRARDLFEALLPDRARVLGPDHHDTLTARSNLASWTGEAGDAERARDLFEALLPDRARVLGPDHPDTLTARNNLAAWAGKAGDAERARDLFEALLPDLVRVLGPDHPDTFLTRNNLAAWAGKTGDAERARDLFEALLPDLVRVLGPDHQKTLTARSNLAFWTGEAGDAERARHLIEALLPDRVRVLGPDHPDTLLTRKNLATWTRMAGDPERALNLYEALLPDQVRVLGPDHPQTLSARNNIAVWTSTAGDPERAQKMSEALLPDQVRVLGPDHPDTLTTRSNLAYWARNANGSKASKESG